MERRINEHINIYNELYVVTLVYYDIGVDYGLVLFLLTKLIVDFEQNASTRTKQRLIPL